MAILRKRMEVMINAMRDLVGGNGATIILGSSPQVSSVPRDGFFQALVEGEDRFPAKPLTGLGTVQILFADLLAGLAENDGLEIRPSKGGQNPPHHLQDCQGGLGPKVERLSVKAEGLQ